LKENPVLVAHDTAGRPVEAARNLPPGDFTCPACAGPLVLKRGRVKIAHFAHLPGPGCWAEGESITHLRAKELLARRFREAGYEARPEQTYPQRGRRIDIAVTIPARGGSCRVAVEIQDSPIAVNEMKARTRVDRSLGFIGTVWVFTGKRARALLAVAGGEIEVRVPNEMLWADNRYGHGVFVLDVDAGLLWSLQLLPAWTREYYSEYGDRRYSPRTLRRIRRQPASFTLTCRRGRYDGEWAVIFPGLASR
jgi:hypothetical protein